MWWKSLKDLRQWPVRTPWTIIWPEPNGQQFNAQETDPYLDGNNVTRITPALVDENNQCPSFTLTALGVIPVGPNSLEATDGDIVVRFVLVQPCVREARQHSTPGTTSTYLFYLGK